MGCGTSKSLEKRLQDQDDKLKQIMEKNEILQEQIKELKDQRNKRKATYIIKDQEIDDLNIFKTTLDKRFVDLQSHIEQLHSNLKDLSQYESPVRIKRFDSFMNEAGINHEDQWKKSVSKDNDYSIKAVEAHDLSNIEIVIDLDDKIPDQHLQVRSNVLNNLNSFLEISNQQQQASQLQQIMEEKEERQGEEEEKVEIPKPPPTRQRNEIEVQQSIKNILEDDGIKNAYEGIKSRMYKDRHLKPLVMVEVVNTSPVDEDIKINNQVLDEPVYIKTQQLQKQKATLPPSSKSAQRFYSDQIINQKQAQESKPLQKRESTKKSTKKFNY